MCRYIDHGKRAHMGGDVTWTHFFPNKSNILGCGRDTLTTSDARWTTCLLYMGDDTEDQNMLR